MAHLMSHWATRVGGGDRKGDELAEIWERGKKSTCNCLGVIICENRNCDNAVRSFTNHSKIEEQLQDSCGVCGAPLVHQKCSVCATLWKWSSGIHYAQNSSHPHLRPPQVLHLLNSERKAFSKLVEEHPNTGPLGLIVGILELTGPGKSVADISPVFLNADRVLKERWKIKHNVDGTGGDNFIATFAKFTSEYSNFVLAEVFGPVTVISLQSPLMVSQLVQDKKVDSSVNGLVNDVAHGWWKEKNSLLMITSVYLPELSCWIPGLMLYTNGASSTHFKWHFLALFEGMAAEAAARAMVVDDELFAGVYHLLVFQVVCSIRKL